MFTTQIKAAMAMLEETVQLLRDIKVLLKERDAR